MVIAGKGQRGPPSDRAKASKSVRLDDRQGFDHKFNKTGFKSEAKRHLYYYYVKCYEQVLRGKEASSVLTRRDFLRYRRLAATSRLKPLPDGFRDFKNPEKVETLNKLIEEQVDAGVGIVQQLCEDVESVHGGKMEVDEGSVADLGPECSINEFPHGDSLQSVARDFQDHPQGRPPPCCDQHLESFQQCASELKRWASRYSDILMEVERWEQQGTALITKLRERDIWDSEGVDSSNTLARSREEEIFSQLQEDIADKDPPYQFSKPLIPEGIGLEASYSQASNSLVKNVQRGAEIYNAATKLDQEYAVDPRSTASSLIVPPDRCISEALKFTPSYTGRLKANLEEIHPRVAGDLQYKLSKPMMEVSHPQASDLWGSKLCGEGYLMTMPHSGVNSVSQIAPIGHSISAELSGKFGLRSSYGTSLPWRAHLVRCGRTIGVLQFGTSGDPTPTVHGTRKAHGRGWLLFLGSLSSFERKVSFFAI